jgi:nicotinamidase-related amidase
MSNARTLIHPRSTVLVVIDLQEKLVPAIDGIEGILGNTAKLLQLAKTLELKTMVTTQYRKGLGEIVPEIQEMLADVGALDKVCFGCLGDDPFRIALAQTLPPGGTLLLTGVESHICVMQSAMGALDHGYNVHVVSDAIGSRSPANRALGIGRMRDAGAIITSTEMAIYELLGNSSRPEFKQMLPHLK